KHDRETNQQYCDERNSSAQAQAIKPRDALSINLSIPLRPDSAEKVTDLLAPPKFRISAAHGVVKLLEHFALLIKRHPMRITGKTQWPRDRADVRLQRRRKSRRPS